ncbi:hypothetical protein Ahp2_57 [Aeromonas phage Ahp2]|nr:hypothetical protein Ahp2_57 [Aeromonas phage Ahp2]
MKGAKVDAALLEVIDQAQQIDGGAGQTVKAPDNHGVALAGLVQKTGQAGAVFFCSRSSYR